MDWSVVVCRRSRTFRTRFGLICKQVIVSVFVYIEILYVQYKGGFFGVSIFLLVRHYKVGIMHFEILKLSHGVKNTDSADKVWLQV